ncbi:MAG: efflux transporter outer membrane subunit [Gammaproteobacteria bacterium]
MTSRSALALSLLSLLGGCASTWPVADLKMPLPEAWRNARPAVASSITHPLPADTRYPGAWWHVFHDAELDKLIDTALQSSLSIAAAGERLRAARALVPAAIAPYRPELSAATGFASTPDARANYFQYSFDATWELPLFNRAENARRASTAEIQQAAANVAAVQSSVAAEVACAYFETQSAERRTTLLGELLKVTQATLNRVQARVRAGLDEPETIDAAETALVAVQARSLEPEPARAQGLQRIAVLLGRAAIDPSWTQYAQSAQVPALRIETTPADLLRARPDIHAAEAEVVKAAATLGIAQADLYPHMNLLGAITAATLIGGVGRSGSSGNFAAAPAISLPLFDWGKRRAVRDARSAQLAAAVLDYRQSVLEAVAETESALTRLNHSMDLVELLRRAVAARQETRRATAARLRAGLSEESAVSAECAAIETRLSLAEAEFQGALAIVQLYKALGGAGAPADA